MKTILTAITLMFIFSNGVIAQTVNVCDDEAEWPPYSFYERVSGKINKNKIKGAMIEVLGEITKLTNLKFKVKLLPWKRCLRFVHNFGEHGKYEMFIDGTFNEDRASKYYLTSAIYFTSSAYWYSTKYHPNGLSIKSFADLKKYKACGVLGYNYDGYGFKNNEGIYRGAQTLEAVLQQIDLGRCDLLPQSSPTVYGFKALGKNIIPKGVVFKKIPEPDKETSSAGGFYIFIAKTSPRAYELLTRINQAVILLDRREIIHKIMLKYLPSCGRNC